MHISNFSDVPTISKKCSHLIVTGLGRPGLPPCWNDIASTAIGSATKIFKILTFKFSYYLQSPNTILIFEIPFFQNFDIKKTPARPRPGIPTFIRGRRSSRVWTWSTCQANYMRWDAFKSTMLLVVARKFIFFLHNTQTIYLTSDTSYDVNVNSLFSLGSP